MFHAPRNRSFGDRRNSPGLIDDDVVDDDVVDDDRSESLSDGEQTIAAPAVGKSFDEIEGEAVPAARPLQPNSVERDCPTADDGRPDDEPDRR